MQNKKLIITKDNSSKNAPNKTDTIIVKVNTDAKSLSNLKIQSIQKSDVSSATTKTNRMAGVEKNGAVNKGTAFINATFNVNLAFLINLSMHVLDSNEVFDNFFLFSL